jgi:hypothetical protein
VKPGLHDFWHMPEAHAGEPFSTLGHEVSQLPQWLTWSFNRKHSSPQRV